MILFRSKSESFPNCPTAYLQYVIVTTDPICKGSTMGGKGLLYNYIADVIRTTLFDCSRKY